MTAQYFGGNQWGRSGASESLPTSFGRAFDLSALKTANTAQKQSAQHATADGEAGSEASQENVFDVTEATFAADVAQRSMTMPVVLDFWADWCGPCKQLSPVLERYAASDGGAWVLGKVDIDAQPRLAAAFGVQSIPMVVAIVGGQPIDAFAGVVPADQLRQWLTAVVQAAGRQSNGQPATEEQPNPAEEESVRTARTELTQRVAELDIQATLQEADSAPTDVSVQLRAADVEAASGRPAAAYERLVKLVRMTSGEDRERVRVHLVELFRIAPAADEDVRRARRALASALF